MRRQVFINDIRQCQSKEAERARIDKELANIRTKFKSDRSLSSYEKKKYVWKLLYIYVLGYDVEFGHMEAVSLISSTKFSEKQVGYIAASVLLHENLEFVRLVINTMQKDLVSPDENFQCMALAAIANMGGREFAEALAGDVQKLLISSHSRPVVRKKAALCLLRLFRRNPDILSPDTWAQRMGNLLQERDLGVLLSCMALLNGLVAHAQNGAGYESVIPRVVQVLERVARGVDVPQDYTYYGIPSPWLHIKALRVLHYFPVIDNDSVFTKLVELLRRTINNTPIDSNVNKNNALHSILFESISLLMHLNVAEDELLEKCVSLLGKFIVVKEPNIRYLALENMSRLSLVPEMMDAIKKHQSEIVLTLHDPDISIRRRGLDLLYGMCDHHNATEVVDQLLTYLTTADFAIREELALKIAILSERFASSLAWYVDVILSLINKAGDHVSDEVWYRVVQIVTNNDELQGQAAANVYGKLQEGAGHETMLKVASYILGEFGHLLEGPGLASPMDVFSQLKEHLGSSSSACKGLILSAFAKMVAKYPGDAALTSVIHEVFQRYGTIQDAELQQRAVEYSILGRRKEIGTVMASMPKFPERESSLVKLISQENGTTEGALPLERERTESQTTAVPKEPALMADALPAPSPVPANVSPLDDLLSLDVQATGAPPPEPTATNGVAQAAAADPMDLLSGLSMADGPPPSQGIPAAAPAPSGGADPFGGLSDLSIDSAPSEGGIELRLVGGTIEAWHAKLCLSNKGILYQDQFLQIGVKADYRRHEGRVTFFFGNKHTGDLTNCIVSIPPLPSYRVQLGPAPKTIAAQAQVQLPFSIACLEATLDAPTLQVAYDVDGQSMKTSLRLPVLPIKFFAPVTNIDASTFFAQWKSIAEPPLKLQQVVQVASPLDMGNIKAIFTQAGMGVAEGCCGAFRGRRR